MNELQPSRLLNRQQAWLTYGLSRIDRSMPGENNMSHPGDDPRDPRRIDWADQSRHRFLAAIDANLGIPVMTHIQHFGYVQTVVEQGQRLPAAGSDALITNQPGIVLMTLFADCSPIILVDPAKQAVGLIHAGWQGSLHNVVGNTIMAMQQSYGTNPEDLEAYIGPTICAYHYPRAYSDRELGLILNLGIRADVDPVYIRRGSTLYGDIVATNTRILLKYGVNKIESSGICTFESPDQPSARRDDRKLGGPFRSNAMAAVMIQT